MKWSGRSLMVGVALAILALPRSSPAGRAVGCPPDSVQVGPLCVDKYEASVWNIPTSNTRLIELVKEGKATLANLTRGGATLVSPSLSCAPSFPATFPETGNWTAPLYAASVAGVLPTACVTWFQANQACALSGKRLLRNDEWQRAAAGTPDGAPCIVSAGGPGTTGTAGCVSSWGTFDMVGNVDEWVADWADLATNCTTWRTTFGSDYSCFGGSGNTGNPGESGGGLSLPGALVRGGAWVNGTAAGVFAVGVLNGPSDSFNFGLGFRCAR